MGDAHPTAFNNAVNNGVITRGHLTAFRDRDRNAKDAVSTFLTTNLIPQHIDNNITNTAWFKCENYLERTLVQKENKEVHLIAGGYFSDPSDPDLTVNRAIFDNGEFIQDENGRFLTPTKEQFEKLKQENIISQTATLEPRYNSKNIAIPDFTWKIAVVLQPNQGLSDITVDTQVIAIITPNSEIPTDSIGNIQLPNQPSKQITNWRAWPQWRVSVNYLEEITGYDFFSNLSDDIEEAIEDDASSALILPLESASLLAVPESTFSLSNSSISSGITTGIDSSIRHDRFVGIPTQVVAFSDISLNRTFEVSTNQTSLNDSAFLEIRPSEISPIQTSQEKVGSFQISISENSSPQIGTIKVGSSQNSTFQIDTLKTNLYQIGSTQINTAEVSLSSSITLQQFLSSHNNTSQNTTVPTWLQFLQDSTPFNLNIEITDLPTGQLAVACWR